MHARRDDVVQADRDASSHGCDAARAARTDTVTSW